MSCGKCDKKCDAKEDAKEEKEDLGKPIGKITHYYSHLNVGIIELAETLKVGDKIKIKGHSTDLEQNVDSMQVNHEDVQEAKKGDVIGVKVSEHVREGDKVYLS